jgi:hypothetical protein
MVGDIYFSKNYTWYGTLEDHIEETQLSSLL